MKRQFKINERNKSMNIPIDMIRSGWKGSVDAYDVGLVVLLIKPGVEDIMDSVKIIESYIKIDMKLRAVHDAAIRGDLDTLRNLTTAHQQ